MKKKYSKPEMRVVTFRRRLQILLYSGDSVRGARSNEDFKYEGGRDYESR
jgi:hypothetical protein